jgi:hypothetical protein
MAFGIVVLMSVGGALAADPLAEEIAPYTKPGEKLEQQDFAVPPIPEADNAALELRVAAKIVNQKTAVFQGFEQVDSFEPPLSDATVKVLRAVVAENQPFITHIDVAMKRKGVDWQIAFKSPVLETLLPHLNDQRMMANLLLAHAAVAHLDGDDAEVLRDVQRTLFISRTVDHQPFIVTHLVSVSISTMGCAVVGRIAPDLKVTDSKQVKDLVAMLLDDGPPRTGLHEALLAERMSIVDTGRCVIDGRLTPQRLGQVAGNRAVALQFSPEQVKADVVMMLAHSTAMIAAFDATSNWPGYKARDPGFPAELTNNRQKHPFAGMMYPALSRVFEQQYRSATERRLAAVALAVRAYAAANNGKLPETLEALVPQYLPSVPDDPMAEARPLQYEPDPARPIVYSVGTNGTDDAGSEDSTAKNAGRWQQNDAVMHLSRAPAQAAKQP